MVTGEIRNQVDRIWDTFYAGGIANPIVDLTDLQGPQIPVTPIEEQLPRVLPCLRTRGRPPSELSWQDDYAG